MPGHEDKVPFGNRPNGIYIPRFRNVKTKQKEFLRGYGYQGGGSREGWHANSAKAGIGVELKNSIKIPGPGRMGIGGFRDFLPYHRNYVDGGKKKAESGGIPSLKIQVYSGGTG